MLYFDFYPGETIKNKGFSNKFDSDKYIKVSTTVFCYICLPYLAN